MKNPARAGSGVAEHHVRLIAEMMEADHGLRESLAHPDGGGIAIEELCELGVVDLSHGFARNDLPVDVVARGGEEDGETATVRIRERIETIHEILRRHVDELGDVDETSPTRMMPAQIAFVRALDTGRHFVCDLARLTCVRGGREYGVLSELALVDLACCDEGCVSRQDAILSSREYGSERFIRDEGRFTGAPGAGEAVVVTSTAVANDHVLRRLRFADDHVPVVRGFGVADLVKLIPLFRAEMPGCNGECPLSLGDFDQSVDGLTVLISLDDSFDDERSVVVHAFPRALSWLIQKTERLPSEVGR